MPTCSLVMVDEALVVVRDLILIQIRKMPNTDWFSAVRYIKVGS